MSAIQIQMQIQIQIQLYIYSAFPPPAALTSPVVYLVCSDAPVVLLTELQCSDVMMVVKTVTVVPSSKKKAEGASLIESVKN